ncbi:C4-dicarboxylic acid transporter DauA [Thiomicrospira microaerophila]|uniref:C4-dicarboxylic acid transporter DauA n=1 Tax=Thiomicrospira microaerophila TaxID=406020 RepID=UPI00200BBB6A|nr:C4-dicarboxylic acid transporter DauA [Thiomicrospira microaerophila]UQB42391.1 C4-dicarboxylic acid transporter DauA [Thiomicrospira microaerophila]
MSQRNHLTNRKLGYGLRDFIQKEGYNRKHLGKDIVAGLTVGILAIPVSMALAMGIGISPIYGLYTAIVAGFVTALLGGSRFSVAGPTASLVILLIPVNEIYGLLGITLVSLLTGLLLILMAYYRFGRWIEYIPETITLGFTTGIATVIILLQINFFFGLALENLPSQFLDRLSLMLQALVSQIHWPSTLIGAGTLVFMIGWKRLNVSFPGHLPSLVIATLIAFYWNHQGADILTIGSLFGEIPHHLPIFQGPEVIQQLALMDSAAIWGLISFLLPIALTLALLISMESLLCASVLDNQANTRHSPNSELQGQGLGNMASALFGGFASSGAIARSMTNFRAGAVSPVASMIHAVVVVFAIYFLAGFLEYIPLAAMSALLIVVAWNMSAFPRAIALIRGADRGDLLVYLACFSLILLVDIVYAVIAGMVLASVLFIKDIAEMTKLQNIGDHKRYRSIELPTDWIMYRIQGPLFFAAADRIFAELIEELPNQRGIIIQMDAVTILDSGGLSALRRFVASAEKQGVDVYLSELQFQPLRTLARYGLDKFGTHFKLFSSLEEAQAAIYPQNQTVEQPTSRPG